MFIANKCVLFTIFGFIDLINLFLIYLIIKYQYVKLTIIQLINKKQRNNATLNEKI